MEHIAEDYANAFSRKEKINISAFELNQDNEEFKTNDKVSNNIFANIKQFQHEEYQYLNLLDNIIKNGSWEQGRNGKTKSIFGHSMRFSLENGSIPILTTKKTAWKTCLKELLWFIRGETDNTLLKEQNVNIWNANASRNFLDSRGLHHYPENIIGPCFVKGTKVLTNEGYKNIEEIKDCLVYTHYGNFFPVVKNMVNKYSGQMYKIRPKYSPYDIICTSEHPFYAKKFIVKDKLIIDGVEKKNVVFSDDPEFIKAKDLIKGQYFLGMKIEEKEIVPKFTLNGVHSNLENLKFWWMMGFFTANGWLEYEKNTNSDRYKIYFLISNNKIKDNYPKLHSVIPGLLHIGIEHGWNKFCSTDDEVANILKLFGKNAKNKLIPNFVHEAPIYLITEFLRGYLDADECKRHSRFKNSFVLTTVSHNLAFNIQRLYFKLGYIGSLQFCKKKNKKISFSHNKAYNYSDVYLFEVHKNKKNRGHSFIENGYVWLTIKNIEIENVNNIDVYNLSVLNDNSYIVNNIAVHNCYGYQWRQFNANYNCFTGKRLLDNESNDIHKNRLEFKGVDQLQQIIDALKDPNQRTSRRLVMTAWNPCQLNQMALPPCHILCQFNVHDGNKLSCAMYQRSVDTILGQPFNIASYSFLTHLLAKHCGLKAHELVYFMGNCHLYENAIDAAKLQITRNPYTFPTLSIIQNRENINDYQIEDFKLSNYMCHEQIKVDMIA